MKSHRKGELAQLKVELKALEKGYISCRPSSVARYDLVIDDGSSLYRVQVKYADGRAVHTENAVIASLGSTNRQGVDVPYGIDEVDTFAIYVPKVDSVLWVPAILACNKNKLQIKIAGKRQHNSFWYEDYIW